MLKIKISRSLPFILTMLIAGMAPLTVFPQKSEDKIILPARFDEHRIFVEPVLENGKTVLFYTDTGGGLFIYKKWAETLNLITPGLEKVSPINFPVFNKSTSIPAPIGSKGRLFVLKRRENSKDNYYGMLGQAWFADRIWTFDYPRKQLLLWDKTPKKLDAVSESNKVKLAFKNDLSGKRVLHFPRIQVEIDDETLDLLFDTGATTYLAESALNQLNDGGKTVRSTSFITNLVFSRWQKRHPDWRIIEKAESTTGEAMIEVPKIKIAGYTIGPVWFTRRANKNFHEFMSRFMDKRVEGAIGGNALRYFRVTVDYPKAIAYFERE